MSVSVCVCVYVSVVVTLCASIIVSDCCDRAFMRSLEMAITLIHDVCECECACALFDSILMPRQMSDYYSDYVSPIVGSCMAVCRFVWLPD